MHTCGIILAGGKSSRMGTNKSLLTINDKPAIQHIAEELQTFSNEVVVITNDPKEYDFLDLQLFEDRYIDKGPLAGLETALHHVDAELFIIAACDMPFIDSRVYNYLLNCIGAYDAIVPIYDNQIHPLSGIYKRNVLSQIQLQLDKDELKVTSFFEQINIKYIQEFNGIDVELLKRHFFNMNNPDQYEEAKRL